MKIYIAGKITGDKHYKRKFRKYEKKLTRLGHSVMSPAWLGASKEFTWEHYMAVSRSMQEVCEGVFFLPDWRESAGARQEMFHTCELRQKMFFTLRMVPKNN